MSLLSNIKIETKAIPLATKAGQRLFLSP
jgi:hypothetical protein